MIEVKNTLNGKLNASIVKEYPELEEITVTPTLDGQELEPSKYGYSKITIKAIPATDVTITPTTQNQKQEGIFKTVTVNAIEGQELNLNPSEEQQNFEGVFLGVNVNPIQVKEITTDLDFGSSDAIELLGQEGTYIKKATINKPTNLVPENIKLGETVCGISGINADTSDADATSEDIVAGKTAYVANEKVLGTYKPLDTSDATATAEDIAKDKTAYVNGIKVTGTLVVGGDYNAKIDNNFSTASSSNLNSHLKRFIRELNVDDIDFTIWTLLSDAFNGYSNAIKITGTIDCSNATHISYLFADDKSLEECPVIINTKNVKNMAYMFSNCQKLKKICQLDASSCSSVQIMFNACYALEDFGGLLNLGKGYTGYATNSNTCKLDLSTCTKLTHDSLMNVINGLYDLNLTYDVANGGTLATQQLILGSTNKAKLTASEIAIATNKGWTVS